MQTNGRSDREEKEKKKKGRRFVFEGEGKTLHPVVRTCNKFLNYASVRGETGSVSKFK